jgi:hypothetical protein
MIFPSGNTYELKFRSDIRPHKCQIPFCFRTAEIIPKQQRSRSWRLPPRTSDDPLMGEEEWGLWSAQGFLSYCPTHKCDVEGCDSGVIFDENNQIYNMCLYHKSKEGSRKNRSSMSKFASKIFSTGSPKREVQVRGVLPKQDIGEGKIVVCPNMCSVKECQRLQILDAQGNPGECAIHARYPLLEKSERLETTGERTEYPPVAVMYNVNIAGQSGEAGMASVGPAAVAGFLIFANGIFSTITSGL